MQKKIGKLRLMGHDVDLIVTDRDEVLEKLTGELVLGACRCDQCKIWLDATLSVSQMQSTLYHEVNEFIRLNTGAHYSDDHDYFTAYHTIIWGEINNNKDWIFGNALKRALKP